MSLIIKDLQVPKITDISEDGTFFKVLSGYLGDIPFEFWYGGPAELALKRADIAWESKKKNLYGPTTHVETIFGQGAVMADKYGVPV